MSEPSITHAAHTTIAGPGLPNIAGTINAAFTSVVVRPTGIRAYSP